MRFEPGVSYNRDDTHAAVAQLVDGRADHRVIERHNGDALITARRLYNSPDNVFRSKTSTCRMSI